MQPNKIMHIDLETQNNKHFGAVASPRHPDNYVVMVGQAIDEQPYSGAITHEYYNNAEEAKNWLNIPDDVWLLVAHNAPYELDWMLHQQRDKITAFLKRGGRVYCTAYGHYLLSNQQDTYPALDEIAPLYGGSHKVDGIKILWEQGVLTKDIDRDLLTEYLVGPKGDIENTRKCFYGQYSKLIERGMWRGAITRMEGMLYCAFAVDSGLYVYKDLAYAQMAIQEKQLNALKESFLLHRAQFPVDAEFKETSRFHMSAWIYGGPLKYRSRRPYSHDGSPEQYVKADFYQFGEKFIPVDAEPADLVEAEFQFGAPVVYKAGKNKGERKVFRLDTDEVKLKWTDQIHVCPGLASMDALPQDIRKEFVQEFSGKQTLADGSPVFSTAKDAIEVMSKRREFSEEVRAVLASLLEFAKLDKDLGTYYLREECDDDGNIIKQAGMLQYLDDLCYVHHNLNCTSTVTGRLSSNKPRMLGL